MQQTYTKTALRRKH